MRQLIRPLLLPTTLAAFLLWASATAAQIPQSGAIPVNTYTTGVQKLPAVGVFSDGSFVIVWQSDGADDDTDLGSVHFRRYSSGGLALSAQAQVNNVTTGSPETPRVAVPRGSPWQGVPRTQAEGRASGALRRRAGSACRPRLLMEGQSSQDCLTF